MRSRWLGIFFILVALFAGCGDDDSDSGDTGGSATTETVATGNPAQQDAEAKSAARELVSFVEACFVDQMSYAGCENAAEGEDLGEATVEGATDTTFTVVSPSESGNEFRLEKTEAGELERTCETAGEGVCGSDGTW
jgi:hypothetical protein